ncbi:kinase-like domain-containing protein [Daldinia vernicosa]|uniref:kinase-like domain-containing protein n=1 Tax=Daldinia vernicosa TaxID=114800 RepID=UPI0020074E66|nr:kinase-like domain-containing protein [Daldinia vernicosa]KAI0849270.1 kinase-like domain-containing protein [Daldinia vernicosa]
MEPSPLRPHDNNADIMFDHGHSLEIITTLQTRLDDCLLGNETGKQFIPDGTLERILDENTVGRVLSELSILRDKLPDGPKNYARKICGQNPPFRKILALLLLTDIPEAIVPFVDLGIDDLALPMPDPRILLSYELSGSCDDEDAAVWNEWNSLADSQLKRSDLRNIYVRQWCLLSPRFIRRDSIPHYIFTHDYILPFLQNGFDSPGGAKLSYPLDESVRNGSFSQVRRVKIHPNHYDFGDYGISNPDHQFAVKKLWTPDYEDFAQEIEGFKRHWRSHINIVPLLATYEIRETVADEPLRSYCMIFPWATGDLRSFWEMNEELVGDIKVLPWFARECYEIARALSCIHGDTRHPTDNTDSFGRHGDIKPSNILWYPNACAKSTSDLGKLVLSDFGLADFHRATSTTSSRTSSLPRSMTYRAPEFDTTKVISQAIDIWSLGCTFLEFITWFLKGSTAARVEFPEHRMEIDIYGINADTFFTFQHHQGQINVLLKHQVVTWIEGLRNDKSCNGYPRDFLDMIQYDMLVVNCSDRRTAAEIFRKLGVLRLQCVGDVDSY